MTVIPSEQGDILGKINLSIEGAGKVDTGQQVNIRIDNYPYLQYGMVRGVIRNISLIPEDREYVVEVNLPDGLTTYYGNDIPLKQEMQGTAEILTDRRRLLERIIAPIRATISEQKAHSL
jgi:HlyD family secretion protein